MPIDDKQLDGLLRDVSVPSDLKASLLQIPDQELQLACEESAPRSRTRLAVAGLLAAIAASVLIFVYLPATRVTDQIPVQDNSEAAELLLARMERNLEAMSEIQQIADLDFAVQQTVDVAPVVNLEESIALAMSLSWKSSLDRGLSIEAVKPELEYVIDTFPGTRGADHAKSILQIN